MSEHVWFRRVCRVITAFPIVLGGIVALTGTTGFEVLFGTDAGTVIPTLESAVRFLAASFSGMGFMFLWATHDIENRSGAIQIFFATMIFGAVARLIGIRVAGAPNLMSLVLVGIELTGIPMWIWYRAILRRSRA